MLGGGISWAALFPPSVNVHSDDVVAPHLGKGNRIYSEGVFQ